MLDPWLTKREAADHLAVSVSTIERNRIPWQPDAVPKKIRAKTLSINGRPRFYGPDVEAMLEEKPRSAFQKVFGRYFQRSTEDVTARS